jgi:hypothetical protein
MQRERAADRGSFYCRKKAKSRLARMPRSPAALESSPVGDELVDPISAMATQTGPTTVASFLNPPRRPIREPAPGALAQLEPDAPLA